MYSYIIVSDTLINMSYNACSDINLIGRSALGHELFLTRKILMVLYYNKYITKETTLVTAYSDRKFLYTNYFNNVLDYDAFIELNPDYKSKYVLNFYLDLRPYINSYPYFAQMACHHIRPGYPEIAKTQQFCVEHGAILGQTIEQLHHLGLDKEYLTQNKVFQNINTAEFNKFICNLDYMDLTPFNDIIKENFFVLHIRPTYKNIDYLLEFIEYCNSTANLKCIIFTNIETVNYPYITNDLRAYASLLNHINCHGLIGEWSGGSQLSHFCAKKVIYYYDNYPHRYFTEDIAKYKEVNDADFYACWDQYNPIHCTKMFINQEEFLDKSTLLNKLLND